MAIDTLIGLVLTFISTSAALLQVIEGTHRMERWLEDIHQRLMEIRDK